MSLQSVHRSSSARGSACELWTQQRARGGRRGRAAEGTSCEASGVKSKGASPDARGLGFSTQGRGMAGTTASLQRNAVAERSALDLRTASPHRFGFLMGPEGRHIRGSGGGLRRADCTLRICWSCCPAPPSSLLLPSLWPLRLDQRLPCFLRPEAEAHRTARSSCRSGGHEQAEGVISAVQRASQGRIGPSPLRVQIPR